MGSGSSAKKGNAKYKTQGAAKDPEAENDGADDDQGGSAFRPCDKCGETRKTARFGGKTAQWLCAACQLESGEFPVAKPRRVTESMQAQAPQPLLRRSNTTSLADVSSSVGDGLGASAKRKSRRAADDSAIGEKAPGDGVAPRRSRRPAKERALAEQEQSPSPAGGGGGPKLRRADTVALTVVEDRQDFRSLKGLNELRGSVGRAVTKTEPEEDDSAPAPAAPPPPKRKKKLPGGYFYGDKVASLISRVRGGLLILELGNEGTVVGARGSDGDPSNLKLLVQFERGFDWFLPPSQICLASSLASAKGSGLARFNWGMRVRSFVAFLSPAGSKRSVWLGDVGTVIGPGRTPGKIAVRFDDGPSEWSIWPSALCEADAYNQLVQQKVEGGYIRGQRVRATGAASGIRSLTSSQDNGQPPLAAKEPLTVSEGDEGTIIGPGHANGRVLVHFDSDDKVWSMPLAKLASSAA